MVEIVSEVVKKLGRIERLLIELNSKIDSYPETAQLIGHYAALLRLIQRKEFERLKELFG